jgi:hypothetical protein
VKGRTVVVAALIAVASLVVAPSLTAPSEAGVRPCTHGYTYAGYASREGAHGVTARIAALSRPSVESGHAAAWVGVGGIRQGPGRVSEWLQAGIAAFPGAGLHLYVEEVSRGEKRRFVDLGRAVPGRRYEVRVVETRNNFWRAYINGRSVGKPAYLPTAASAWRAVATAESWASGHASCNRYAYRFDGVSIRRSDGWKRLADAERVGVGVTRDPASFSASY